MWLLSQFLVIPNHPAVSHVAKHAGGLCTNHLECFEEKVLHCIEHGSDILQNIGQKF